MSTLEYEKIFSNPNTRIAARKRSQEINTTATANAAVRIASYSTRLSSAAKYKRAKSEGGQKCAQLSG